MLRPIILSIIGLALTSCTAMLHPATPNDYKRVAQAHNMFLRQGRPIPSTWILPEALEKAKENNDTALLAYTKAVESNLHLFTFYNYDGDRFVKFKEKASQDDYFQMAQNSISESLEIADENISSWATKERQIYLDALSFAMTDWGSYYINEEEYAKSNEYFVKLAQLSDEFGTSAKSFNAYVNISNNEERLGNAEAACEAFDDAQAAFNRFQSHPNKSGSLGRPSPQQCQEFVGSRSCTLLDYVAAEKRRLECAG